MIGGTKPRRIVTVIGRTSRMGHGRMASDACPSASETTRIPVAFAAILLITAAGSRAVRMTLDPTPRWPIVVGIVVACLVGVNLISILAAWPYPSWWRERSRAQLTVETISKCDTVYSRSMRNLSSSG